MKQLFDNVSIKTSKMVTNSYSTSFSLGIKFLHKQFQDPIYSIYGFVRFADEIVDTFHDFNKKELLDEFKIETYRAIERGISLNPVLNSFQKVVNDFKIDHKLIDTFLRSMEMDLEKKEYSEEAYKDYILGSAEVVGLMCLRVFVKGNQKMYEDLTPYAMALGSAFQKINFYVIYMPII
jgi:phytoene synthase